ncbi:MAG: prephenate dehydrogenase [Clostridiales bacterium]|jgi:prephenate dehydrogenase|nr:prephenate dehydrogenase [Clostridiales bacterium]
MNIGIIGLGLIGGSFGRAVIKETPHTVYGRDLTRETVLRASLTAAVHKPLTDAEFGLLDVLIIALAPTAFITELADAAPKLKAGALVIDVAGVKRPVVEAMKKTAEQFPALEFIAAHPMAGREHSGLSAASASLFKKASVLVTPVRAGLKTVSMLKELFLALGFDYFRVTTAEEHDEMIAYTSQLPHILSSCYVKNPLAPRHDGFSAGSFLDLTRVARMNSALWTELFFMNKDNVLSAVADFSANLKLIGDALKNDDAPALARLLEDGNLKKEAIDKASRNWKKENKE